MASLSAVATPLQRAGLASLLGVCAGGATLGFFAFYAFITHVHRGAGLAELAFLTSVPLGIAGALFLWSGYARYFARRTGVSLENALALDAVAWTALVLMWIGFLGPFGASATGRGIAIAFGIFACVKLAIAARFNQTVRDVAVTFLVTRIPILVIAELAAVTIAQRPGLHVATSSNPALAVWGRWDAVHYLDIAAHGYYGTDMAFFPLYALLISLLAKLTGNYLIAGLIISNAALFFALLFFYKLVEHQYNRHVAQRAIFYISIFPTAVFFSAVYTESLFLALTVASFYYIREHKWILAGAIGFLAALARVEGVLLAVPFAIEWLQSPAGKAMMRYPLDNIVRPLIGLALIPAGLGTYMVYLWVLRGDPLYFSHVQIYWNRHLAPPWQSIAHSLKLIATATNGTVAANQVIELAFTAMMLALLAVAIRRLSATYWTYMGLSILIPMCTSSLMSMPRFALVLFPMFVILALWGGRASFGNAIVAFSLPLLGLFTVLFASWYWVA